MSSSEGAGSFPQTTWGLVARIRNDASQRQAGLEALCQRYWKPIHSYAQRAWRRGDEDTKDLTQAFFLWLIEGEVLGRYEPGRGSFRHYLKGLLRGFIRNRDAYLARLKRGGGQRHLVLDGETIDPADPKAETPEEAFDRAWVEALLERATEEVRSALCTGGHELRWRVFERYEFGPPGSAPTYASVAEELGLKKTDVANHLYAVRERLRSELRAQLRDTVGSQTQLEEEWRDLFGD